MTHRLTLLELTAVMRRKVGIQGVKTLVGKEEQRG